MTEWPVWKRIAFRFGVVFGALTVVPTPFELVPKLGYWLASKYDDAWAWLADIFGRHVLGTGHLEVFETGSGDTTLSWVGLALSLVLAVLATVAWSIADRRRLAYPRLAELGRVVLRYYLAFIMINYGLLKVFDVQFRAPTLIRLYEPVGHMSPMGILWTFMGASGPYAVFSGLMELTGGVLLLWRATTLVGALVLVPVLTNVVMLNFCYDVAVKLFSSELLVTALVLIAPDVPRLIALVRGRAVPAATPSTFLPPRWRTAKLVVKVLVIAVAGYTSVTDQLSLRGTGRPSSLAGAWQVDRVVRDGVEAPPLATDGKRWKLLVVSLRSALVRTLDDRDRVEPITKDDGGRLELGKQGAAGSFAVARTGDHVTLTGTLDGKPITIELHAVDDSEMLLVHRGFHWIQEHPFNR
ncbi:MAG: hypothetical protein ACM31C_02320 [Acidobacteriota bacterium]